MKPDYKRIMQSTSKEFITVIRRVIKHEKLVLIDIKYIDLTKFFGVVLVTNDRLIMIQNPRNSTKAHIKEFSRDLWDQYDDPVKLLRHIDAGEMWAV